MSFSSSTRASSRPALLSLCLLVVLSLLLSSVPRASAQAVTVYLSYTTALDGNDLNTQACGYAELSCTGTSPDFTCTSLVSGNHYLYPRPGPTYLTTVTPWVTGTLSCGGDNVLPIDSSGFGLELYGGGCVKLHLTGGVIEANPSPVYVTNGLLSFAYNTSTVGVPACPVYTPTYSTEITYFTYIADFGLPLFCGTGALLCNVSNGIQSCNTLMNGTLYHYNGQYATTDVWTLKPGPLNWYCDFQDVDFLLPIDEQGFAFYYTAPDHTGCQYTDYIEFGNPGFELEDKPLTGPNANMVARYNLDSFTTGATPAAAGYCPTPNVVGPAGQALPATVCVILYATTGFLEYPWSIAIKLNVYYNSTVLTDADGTSVQLINATGTRTFTNKYGSAFTTAVTGLSGMYPNRLFLGGQPVDFNGIGLQLASNIQVPGQSPINTNNVELLAADASGNGIYEYLYLPNDFQDLTYPNAPVGVIDQSSVAFVSNIAGFTSVTVNTGSRSAALVNYQTCTAGIAIANGLANRPSSNIGATSLVYRYTYYTTDGQSSTTANLLITCASANPQQDALGNYYQTVVAINGTRTIIDGSFQVISRVTGMYAYPTTSDNYAPQRIYPFSYSSSPPRSYTVSTTPFLDVNGIQFLVDPPVPITDSTAYSLTDLGYLDPSDYINAACYNTTSTDTFAYAVGSGIYSTEISMLQTTQFDQSPLLAPNSAAPYNFTGCGLNADGSIIYVMDANTNTLYASSTSSIALTTAATFGSEAVRRSPVLAVDSVHMVAYVAFSSGKLYSVTLNPSAATYGKAYTTPIATYAQPVTALALSGSTTTLYYALSKSGSTAAALRSVTVNAGSFPSSTTGSLLYSGGQLINPNSLYIDAGQTVLYISDGGATFANSAGSQSALSSQYVFYLTLSNLTNLQVLVSGAAVQNDNPAAQDIVGGVYSDPNAITDDVFSYSGQITFVTRNSLQAVLAFSIAGVKQTASATAYGLSYSDGVTAQTLLQQQTFSIA